jgi:hypothetical protein
VSLTLWWYQIALKRTRHSAPPTVWIEKIMRNEVMFPNELVRWFCPGLPKATKFTDSTISWTLLLTAESLLYMLGPMRRRRWCDVSICVVVSGCNLADSGCLRLESFGWRSDHVSLAAWLTYLLLLFYSCFTWLSFVPVLLSWILRSGVRSAGSLPSCTCPKWTYLRCDTPPLLNFNRALLMTAKSVWCVCGDAALC